MVSVILFKSKSYYVVELSGAEIAANKKSYETSSKTKITLSKVWQRDSCDGTLQTINVLKMLFFLTTRIARTRA